jgi:hypothetical protein
VCVLSFSEGTAGARKIMVNPKDAARIDAFISLDSTAVSKTFVNWDAQGYGWDQYAQFGTYALDGSCLQVFLHTDITNKNADVASTGDTAKKVFSYLHNTFDAVNAEIKRNGGVSPLDFAPGYLTDRLNEGPRYFAPDPSTRVIVEDQIGNNFRIRLPTPIPFSAKCKSEGVCQGPGGVMVCEGGVGCAHTACAVDFARGVMDTYLTPRWNNPEKFSCIGENCLRPFSKDPPLSGLAGWDAALAKSRALRSGGGFAGLAGLGAFGDDVRPTTKEIDMGSLRAEFDALGLPRWDILNTGIAVAGAAAVAAGLSYLVLKD